MPNPFKKPKRPSAPLPEDLDLEAFFTDVEHLRQAFHDFVSDESLSKRILVIHGVGGVGKSTLLRICRLYCKRQGMPVALIAGDEVKSPVDVLRGFAADLGQDDIELPRLTHTLERYREIQAKIIEQAYKAQDEYSKLADYAGKAASKTVEAAAGAMAGAAVGSLVPGIGTAVGTALGGVIGGVGGEAFVDWLRSLLPKSDIELYLDPAAELTQDFLKDLASASRKQRFVLMLDTYEKMAGMDEWVRDLVKQLPAEVLIVIAGREAPGLTWDRDWPGWLAHARIEGLEAMSEEDMRTLVRRYYATVQGGEPDPAQVEEIVIFARGLPLAVTSAVRLWVCHGMQDFSVVKKKVVADLVDRLMEGMSMEMRPALEAAAVLRWFNKALLQELLPERQVDASYDELRNFPFVRSRAAGLALHDVVREMIDEYLKDHDPEQHRLLHKKAAVYFEAWLESLVGDERQRILLERLYHHVRANETAGMQLFQEMAEELVRYRLVDRLRGLLKDVNGFDLEQEQSILWRKYYSARLVQLEGQAAAAERVYQAIVDREHVDPKLRAYALHDLGTTLRGRRISTPEMLERAITCFEGSLDRGVWDYKLAASLVELGPIFRDKGDWDKALEYLDRARVFYHDRGSLYDLAIVYDRLRWYYLYRGDWRQMLNMQALGQETSGQAGDPPFLKLTLAPVLGWIWIGRCEELRQSIDEAFKLQQEIGYGSDWDWGNLAMVLGFSNQFEQADEYFARVIELHRRSRKYTPREEAVALGFWGEVLVRKGELGRAVQLMTQSIEMKYRIQDTSYLLETVNWLGIANEILGGFAEAEEAYSKNLHEYLWTGRRYFECGALTGLVRVKHAQSDLNALPGPLAKAEQVAQHYEYNDHLASLRLTQGHIAWDGHHDDWGTGYDAALPQYQRALTYALRYNRFLLDEVLWGGDICTPLDPIISCCRERDEDGRRMLQSLRDWWQTGINDVGAPRPDTISPIPEGIPLLEAERLARLREPGDGTPQKNVTEKLDAALAEMS